MDFTIPRHFVGSEFEFRPLCPQDAPVFAEAVRNSREFLAPWMAFFNSYIEYTDELALNYINDAFEFARQLREFHFGIFDLKGQFLGNFTYHLNGRFMHGRVVEMSLWFTKELAGKGLGQRVLAEMIRWGFSAWPWLRLEWHCDAENIASARLAQKMGFIKEANLRHGMLSHHGRWIDNLTFGLQKYPPDLVVGRSYKMRDARAEDAEALGRIWADALHGSYQGVVEYQHLGGVNSLSGYEEWRQRLRGGFGTESSGAEVRVVCDEQHEERVLGFYLLYVDQKSQSPMLYGPFVPPPWQNQGLGGMLVKDFLGRDAQGLSGSKKVQFVDDGRRLEAFFTKCGGKVSFDDEDKSPFGPRWGSVLF